MRARTNEEGGSGTWLLRAALAAAVAFAVAGCAGPRVAGFGPPLSPDQYKKGGGPNPDDPYTFEISLDGDGCPAAAPMERAWRHCPGQTEDCVRVKGGQTVQFRSPTNDFVLEFDPFGRSPIDARGSAVILETRKNPNPSKPYTFTIRGTGKCSSKVVDPQIILD